MTIDKIRPLCILKQMWADMFDESCIDIKNPDDGFQGILMLLVTALSRTKNISSNYFNLKSTCEKHIAELEWKTEECNKLKAEVTRLGTLQCDKCSILKNELMRYKKKSDEAQNRIKSIANILKISEDLEESQGLRKNSAKNLVSQLLLEESPKRKKRHLSDTPSPKKSNNYNSFEGVIPETILPGYADDTVVVEQNLEKIDIITSPEEKTKILKDHTSKSINLPVTSVRKSPRSVKKNLSSDFINVRKPIESPKKKLKFNKECTERLSLNGSLVDYVKDVNSELDKIWFNDNPREETKEKESIETNAAAGVSNETSRGADSKKKVWKMKEIRGPSEIMGSKKLRQMKLNLGVKSKEVDLSSLDGYSDDSSTSNKAKVSAASAVNVNSSETKDILDACTEDFKPGATSTQKNEKLEKKSHTGGKMNRSPNYKYKREAVKKKSERMKLDGWDCTNCAEYYGAMGISPSKVKARMNKCSRHRDKFDQLNQTPPDYWNPIFPDTQECREKGLYVSIRCPKDRDEGPS